MVASRIRIIVAQAMEVRRLEAYQQHKWGFLIISSTLKASHNRWIGEEAIKARVQVLRTVDLAKAAPNRMCTRISLDKVAVCIPELSIKLTTPAACRLKVAPPLSIRKAIIR